MFRRFRPSIVPRACCCTSHLCHRPMESAIWDRRHSRVGTGSTMRALFAMEVSRMVLGGGDAKELKELPPKCPAGNNRNAFIGGFRLWEKVNKQAQLMTSTPLKLTLNTEKFGKESEYGSTSRSNS